MDAQLAGVRYEQISLNADEITVIKQAKDLPCGAFGFDRLSSSVADRDRVLLSNVDLDPRNPVREMDECPLSHDARRHRKPPRNSYVAELLQTHIQGIFYIRRRPLAFV